ncbi:hypothetical protein AI27_11900, partial [Sphingomonas sp. BHC-A]
MTPLAALLLMGPPPLMVAALPPDTDVTASDARTVDLQWSGDVHIELEDSGHELVVRFDRPIADAALKDFAAAAGPDLADLRWNDDSLVLRAAAGRKLEAVADKRVLHVRFLPDGEATPAPAIAGEPQRADLDVELAIARAQADAAAGYPGLARRRLAPLAAAYPGDRRIQRLL